MSNILLLLSSPRGDASLSTRVARKLVDRLKAEHPGATVTVRDLAGDPPPHLGADFLGGMGAAAEARSPAQAEAIDRSDVLVDELMAADQVVIASAMVNFGLTTPLKSWFDHVLRAGRTFRYTEAGPEGLAKGKTAYLVHARGGIYSDGPMAANDFQEPYLRALLAFIGITDVHAVTVEGVAFGPEAAEKALAAALGRVSTITAKAA